MSASEHPARLVAGVDVGGTFTDVVLFDAGAGTLGMTKVPSTPADPSRGVLDGLADVVPDLARLERLAHGTTVSTNAILQHAGARVALLTTAGFADAIEIGRTRRMLPSLYDPTFVRPPPLVPRPLRFEVAERLAADGSVLIPLDEAGVERAARRIRRSGAQAVAICFLHAHVDPVHEQRAAAILGACLPGVAVTCSADVVPEFREYERFSTTAINACLIPVMDRYLAALGADLARRGYAGPVLSMSSGGGTMDLAAVRRLPVRTILSGPAGGVAGALWVARAAGVRDLITCDMGGTSTDVCLIEDLAPATVGESALGGYPLKGLQVDINTVGAGGGSIASVEAGGMLRVGPRSAGALPGPACYGLGGSEATVTDANVVLGRLGPRVLGHRIRPDAGRALGAVRALGVHLGIDDPAAMAEGVVRLAVAQMANAIREISIERGHDPGDFVLVAFGGAGPMHATGVAHELGVRDVLIPIFPGNLSALGLLASDQRYDLVRTSLARLATLDVAALAAALAAQADEGRALLAERGFAPDRMAIRHALDMRYARQAFEITVDVPPGDLDAARLLDAFGETYARHYGRADPGREVEIVNLRTTALGLTAKPAVPGPRRDGLTLAGARIATRSVVFAGSASETPVYERERLPVGERFEGPAVVEEAGATTVIHPGWTARIDDTGNLRLTSP